MEKNSSISTTSPWVKTFFLVLFVFVGGALSQVIQQFVFLGKNDIHSLKIAQAITTIFVFLLPAVAVAFLWYKNPKKAYSMEKNPTSKAILLTILLMIVLLPATNLLGHINQQLQLPESLSAIENYMRQTEQMVTEFTKRMLTVSSLKGVFFNLIVIAFLPALCEELFFRGSLFSFFRNKNNHHKVVWIVAIVFSLIHFQMYGFLPRMVAGALLGYLMVWSNSIWLPIIAHFTNNAMAVILFHFSIGAVNYQMENMDAKYIWILGIISLFISGMLLLKIKKELEVK